MKSPDAKFQSYLRREVQTAGKRYEQAVEKVFALTQEPNIQPGSDLSDAILVVGQTLRGYTGALRSLASFAAREMENQPRQPKTVDSPQEHLLVHA
jgi:hypothetical protein